MGITVSSRAKTFKQPRGGFLGLRRFTKTFHDDGRSLSNDENIYPSHISTAVDYLTRVALGAQPKEAFRASMTGACALYRKGIDEIRQARQMIEEISGPDDRSIINACKLSGLDVAFRCNPEYYRPIDEIVPNDATINNVRIMVERTLATLDFYGPVMLNGFAVYSQTAKYVELGDGDYVTKDTLWDLKVTKGSPTTKNTLQILIYYLMGIREGANKEIFSNLEYLGLYNPRSQFAYRIAISDIEEETIRAVEKDVIGF